VLSMSGLDHKGLCGGYVAREMYEVGERDGDGRELEWLGDVGIEDGTEESG